MKNLQFALRLNAAFSMITGINLAFFPHIFATLFGIEITVPFLFIGIGLILFSTTVYVVSSQSPIHLIHVLVIILLDIGWVIGSIAIIGLGLFGISVAGQLAIAVVGVIVLGFAIHQSYALMHVHSTGITATRKAYQFSRSVNGDRETVWSVISDLNNYHNIAPNIDETHVVSGEGEGMVRSCSSGGNSWSETCTVWDPGQKYSFLIDTAAPDYPYPLKHLQGTWGVNPISNGKVDIEMLFEFEYNHPLQALFIHPFMGSWFTSVCKELLDNWEREIQITGRSKLTVQQ
jgi:ribosome-associated toxin RatA of RatAB toxin-antitoxin module